MVSFCLKCWDPPGLRLRHVTSHLEKSWNYVIAISGLCHIHLFMCLWCKALGSSLWVQPFQELRLFHAQCHVSLGLVFAWCHVYKSVSPQARLIPTVYGFISSGSNCKWFCFFLIRYSFTQSREIKAQTYDREFCKIKMLMPSPEVVMNIKWDNMLK